MNSKDNRFYLQALGVSGLFVALILVLWFSFNPPASEDELLRDANATKTAIAMTAQPVISPFVPITGFTATASPSPTATFVFVPSITWTPMQPPTSTVIPVIPTFVLTVIPTSTPAPTRVPPTWTPRPTQTRPPLPRPTKTLPPAPSSTPIPQPTNTPVPASPPTDTPAPTEIPPTAPPATNPPAATDTPSA